jgi:ketosteroid isomerase-like protein
MSQQNVANVLEEHVRSLERNARSASLEAKHVVFERILSENFVCINPRGEIMNKAQALESRRKGEMKYDSLDVSEELVRVHGDTAIVTGRSRVKGRHNNRASSGDYRFTRVYMKQQGEWRIVSSHSTRIQG